MQRRQKKIAAAGILANFRAEAEAMANLACVWFWFVSRVLDLRLQQDITPMTAGGLNLFFGFGHGDGREVPAMVVCGGGREAPAAA